MEQREQLSDLAEAVTDSLQRSTEEPRENTLTRETLMAGYRQLAWRFDPHHGGFLPEPKFPAPHQLLFLLRYWKRANEPKALAIIESTLRSMRRGGIFDQV